MISRSNLKTLIEKWFTLKNKDDKNRENWFKHKINSAYSNGTFSVDD